MRTIGLTGGIGSGKSTVAKALQVLGFPCYDSDSSMKALYHSDKMLQDEMCSVWGEEIFRQNEQGQRDIDRKVFSQVLFSNPENQEILSRIAYPRLIADFVRWRDHHSAPMVFFESAVLPLKNLELSYDALLAVSAPREERIERALRRPGMTREEILKRIHSQTSDEELKRIADFVIVNDGIHPILPQIKLFITQYSKI